MYAASILLRILYIALCRTYNDSANNKNCYVRISVQGWGCSSAIKMLTQLVQGPRFDPSITNNDNDDGGSGDGSDNNNNNTVSVLQSTLRGWHLYLSCHYFFLYEIFQLRLHSSEL
jgi:hypothetical protein